jgi:hypothetical protein
MPRIPALPRSRPALLPFLLLVPLVLASCDGPNLFSGAPVTAPPAPTVDVRAEILRYLEEGTLLLTDETPLRFRWMVEGAAIPLRLSPDLPDRERAAFLRAAGQIRAAGGPNFSPAGPGPEEGAVTVLALSPEAYRAVDPTRPWSFSRTRVTATPEAGISEVQISLSLELEDPVLERATLHALGHAAGIMGHPAFPGGQFVMASSPDGAAPPGTLHPWEVAAIRFLYAPVVRAGMTRSEIRAAWAASGG